MYKILNTIKNAICLSLNIVYILRLREKTLCINNKLKTHIIYILNT